MYKSRGEESRTPVPKPKTRATEVVARPENDRRQRRKFSEEEKARILTEADACTARGQLGELLRREGIYSSLLSIWRKQRETGSREALAPKRPGPKPSQTSEERTIAELERKLAALEKENRIQRKLLELSGKAHEILGLALPRIEEKDETPESSSSDSAMRRSR
jgi:transposase-like protein